jgi:hypothetical protein
MSYRTLYKRYNKCTTNVPFKEGEMFDNKR